MKKPVRWQRGSGFCSLLLAVSNKKVMEKPAVAPEVFWLPVPPPILWAGSERVAGVVRGKRLDSEFAGSLLNGAGLLNKGHNGVGNQSGAGLVTGCDHHIKSCWVLAAFCLGFHHA